jgi:predicted dehydrogenase
VDVVRIGLVGAGPWARLVHAPAIAAHPRAALAGVWTRRPDAAARLAGEHGVRAFADLDELVSAVDAVAFAVPPQVQAGLAVRAAASGRHLICEKPLAATLDAAREVAAAVARAGVVSTMVLRLRFEPEVRRWLAGVPRPAGADTVGSARWLSGSLLGGPFSTSPWRADEGALLDLGPHVIDLLDAALGTVRAVEWAHREEPDLWRFALLHDAGARSTVTVSLRLPVDPSEVEFAVFGRAGTHRLPTRPDDAAGAYRRLLDEFTAAVRGAGPLPPLDAAHGLHLQEVVEQVRAAAR